MSSTLGSAWSTDRARIPNTSIKILARLAKTLIRDRPDLDDPTLASSLARLQAQVDEVDRALIDRFRERNPKSAATEVEFDRSADILWVWLRKLLEGWRDAYGHVGLDALSPALQAKIDLPRLRMKSERARMLHARLFGAHGTSWVSASFIEQSETMATILHVIQQDGLAEDLALVVGDEILDVLDAVQVQYEDMVSARMSRDGKPSDNLRELRNRLRFRLDHYKNTVECLRDPDDPATDELVARALRALTLLNQRLHGASPQELEELEALEFDGDLEHDIDPPVEAANA